MQERRAERGSRGKYARLICQRCRSRKIKCVLPDADGVGPLGVPQPADKSCERCRSYGLDCIVERTVLGRPAAKRTRHANFEAGKSTASTEPDSLSDGALYTPSSLEIKGYMYAEAVDDGSVTETDYEQVAKLPSKQEVFHSMIHPAHFLSSILAKDEAFGSCITHATSRMKTSLSDLISDDLATSLDKCLVWHRFFLPWTPTLVDLRIRLVSDESASRNPATSLLFALLSLAAFETSKFLHDRNPHLVRSIHVAISTYGQDFMFSLPAHRDSVVVCLLLFDYKPTALVTSQSISHRAIQSGLYVNLAYRIMERLELLPEYFTPSELEAVNPSSQEDYLLECLQGLQIHCHEAFLDGFVTKPLRVMRRSVNRMRGLIQAYQNVLNGSRCSPRLIYHVQYIMATFVMMEAVLDMKQNWNNLGSLSRIIEETDRKCSEHVDVSNYFLASPSDGSIQEDRLAARSLLQIQFHAVYVFVCSIGIVYATVLRARLKDGDAMDPEIRSHEALQIGAQVIDSLKNTSLETNPSVSTFLSHYGAPYPYRLMTILEKFLESAEVLKLNGEPFRPPPRHLILEVMSHCKNLVENNVVQLKAFSRLHPSFETQLALFARCAKQFENMVTLPWNSIDAAFANGCLYAVASKVIHGFRDLMEELRTRVSRGEEGHTPPNMLEGLADPVTIDGMGLEFSFDGWELWPHVGGVDVFDSLQDQPGWYSDLNLFPELESQ